MLHIKIAMDISKTGLMYKNLFSLPSGSHQPTSSTASATGVSKNTTTPYKVPPKPQPQPQPKPGMSH
jgi:hypothetical protein